MTRGVVSFPHTVAPRTVHATVTCAHCPWEARSTGDNGIEVAIFLRTRLLEHVAARHPDVWTCHDTNS